MNSLWRKARSMVRSLTPSNECSENMFVRRASICSNSSQCRFAELDELKTEPGLDPEAIPRELLRMADERMYHRKQTMKSTMKPKQV